MKPVSVLQDVLHGLFIPVEIKLIIIVRLVLSWSLFMVTYSVMYFRTMIQLEGMSNKWIDCITQFYDALFKVVY